MDERLPPPPREALLQGPLILTALNRVISVPVLLFALIQILGVFGQKGAWRALTMHSSPEYHWLWRPMIIGEVGCRVGLFVFSLILAWLFFTRRKAYRPAMPAYIAFGLAYLWGEHVLSGYLPDVTRTSLHANLAHHIAVAVGATVAAAIWLPYYLVSKRVKRVFVR